MIKEISSAALIYFETNSMRIRSVNRVFFCAFLCMSISVASVVAESKQSSEGANSRLRDFYNELDRQDVSVIVATVHTDGTISVRESGEFKDDNIPPASTQIDVLSLTKSVTAISILKLVEMKRLSLNDTLNDIFPRVPADKSEITIHQLLTHSSGLLPSCGHDHERLSKNEFLQCVFESKLLTTPGAKYHYSNVGFSVLAAIIEERSRKSYEAFLREDVLAKTALSKTGYASAYEDSRSLRTVDGRSVAAASWGGTKPYWNLVGNGGLVSTAKEFIQFRQALFAGLIISKQLVELAHTPHVPEDPKGTSYYGYGVVVQEASSAGPLLWHDGGSNEYSSEWNELLEHGLTVFIAGRQSDEASAYTAMALLRRELGSS